MAVDLLATLFARALGWLGGKAYSHSIAAEERRRSLEARYSNLIQETNENQAIACRPLPAGGLVIVSFKQLAWHNFRGDIDRLPPGVAKTIKEVYLLMHEYNCTAEEFGRSRDGRLKNSMEVRRQELSSKLEPIIVEMKRLRVTDNEMFSAS